MSITHSGSDIAISAADTTGTSAVTDLAAGDGISMAGLKGVNVAVEMDSAGTIAANASLLGCQYNPQSGVWNRNPDLDLTLTVGLTGQGSVGFPVPSEVGRLAWVPSGVGAACHIYLNGSRR